MTHSAYIPLHLLYMSTVSCTLYRYIYTHTHKYIYIGIHVKFIMKFIDFLCETVLQYLYPSVLFISCGVLMYDMCILVLLFWISVEYLFGTYITS